MHIKNLKDQLKIDEGEVHKIYEDPLGHLTFGIGHKITPDDPEYGLPAGIPVSESRVNEAFYFDVCWVLRDVEILYPDFYDLPEEAQQVIANMMFNLGLGGLSQFRKMKAAVDKGYWVLAAAEMKNSKWYHQVGNRADRLVSRMESISKKRWRV